MITKKHFNFKDKTGEKVNFWTFLEVKKHDYHGYSWLVKCICGTEKIVRTSYPSQWKSCGCQGKETVDILTRQLHTQYRCHASKHRKVSIEFNLTMEEFKNLILQNCYYCNKEPSNTKRLLKNKVIKREMKYNGIDRKNNNIGYQLNNCVTCCWMCNQAKADMNHDEFLQWIKNIYNNRITITSTPIDKDNTNVEQN